MANPVPPACPPKDLFFSHHHFFAHHHLISSTPLANLAGYRINYGTELAALDHSVTINGGATTTYNVAALAPGTWYFAVQAVAATGAESLPSDVASATISL